MWIQFNNNPVKPEGGAGDCAVRAVSKALDVSWEKAYVLLSLNGFLMGDVMNNDTVTGSVLRQHGFVREIIPNTCPECYSVADFCDDHPAGTYVVKSQDHVATVIDGQLFDAWDSSMNIPIYVWRKEE